MIALLLLTLSINFHAVLIRDFSTKPHTHVCTTGTVTLVKQEADGDIHFRVDETKPILGSILPKSGFIVAEVIPQVPLAQPRVGMTVKVCGIRRYDDLHKWWEIHPVLNWERVKESAR